MLCWWLKNDTYLLSTNSPKLTLCSSLSKDKLSDGLGVATMLSRLKSTHAFKQELSSGFEWTILTFKLTHITFHHGACRCLLGLEQLKDRTIKSSAMFQALWSTIISEFFLYDFQNKTQIFLCMTLSSLSFVVFLDPHQGIYGICLLSSLKICGICGIRHSSIMPSLSHPTSNRLIWSS
jgi:hypothetical protein